MLDAKEKEIIRIAEFVKKFGREHVLIGGGKECDQTAAIRGHWLYVRRCLKKARYALEPDSPIVIPEKSREQFDEAVPCWVEVFAKGVECGKRRERRTIRVAEKVFRPPRWIVDAVFVGDLILVQSEHAWGIAHSPWADDEFLVDETLGLLKRRDGKIEPLANNVLIEMKDEQDVQGGIVVPDVAKEETLEGTIAAVGAGLRDQDGNVIPMNVREGEHVLLSSGAGVKIKMKKQSYRVVNEDDILAKMED